mmetsp:Transcript_15116/g.37804  ORF Transcript_15116/g.37804 Transcript_15116/m.37804 type:complete len:204 (+) Transcript_15116:333-944(+)
MVHLLRSEGALKLLSPKEFRLDGLKGLALSSSSKSLCALAVAATIASGDQIGHATTLEEGVIADAIIRVEGLAEFYHLLKPNTNDRSLGVATIPQTINEARTNSHNVLEGATQLNANCVLHCANLEREIVIGQLEKLAVLRVLVTNSSLAESVTGHVVCDICPHQHGAIGLQLLANDVRDEHDAFVIEVNAFDGREAFDAGRR